MSYQEVQGQDRLREASERRLLKQQENLREWVARLLSGRYKQATGQLRKQVDSIDVSTGDPYGYCCLGVACPIIVPEGDWVGENWTFTDEDIEGDLNIELESDLGNYVSLLGITEDEQKKYVSMNDAEHCNFTQIAVQVVLDHPDVFGERIPKLPR